MNNMLHFRRQFLLTSGVIDELQNWQYLNVGGKNLYVHPDLEITMKDNDAAIILMLGSIFDPTHPEYSNETIISDILSKVGNFEELIRIIKPYAGRYAILYRGKNHFMILHDPLGLREIYYCTSQNQVICGSQPNLIIKYANPEIKPSKDPDFVKYYSSHLKNMRWNPICKWIGDETYYEGVKHLLPNHCLDIERLESKRYWPNKLIQRLDLADAVSKSCEFLQGSLKAIANRHPIMMAVTAGTDTRTLLATSKDLKDEIYYFINNEEGLGHNHPDILIPKKIFERIELPFYVHDVPKDVDDEFRRIFLQNTFFASDRIISTIYNIYFKNLNDKVNILGIGEIGRTRFGKEPCHLNSYRMVYKLGYREGKYVIKQGEKILSELLPIGRSFNINVLTLLYWEHHLGNWGVTGNSESDIAIEELDPFDSHQLYEIFLGVDDKFTEYSNPILLKEMIRRMWPELLEYPINPPYTLRSKVIKYLKQKELYLISKEFKYQLAYLRYLFKKVFYRL